MTVLDNHTNVVNSMPSNLPKITIAMGGIETIPKWLVYGIALPTLREFVIIYVETCIYRLSQPSHISHNTFRVTHKKLQ